MTDFAHPTTDTIATLRADQQAARDGVDVVNPSSTVPPAWPVGPLR